MSGMAFVSTGPYFIEAHLICHSVRSYNKDLLFDIKILALVLTKL